MRRYHSPPLAEENSAIMGAMKLAQHHAAPVPAAWENGKAFIGGPSENGDGVLLGIAWPICGCAVFTPARG